MGKGDFSPNILAVFIGDTDKIPIEEQHLRD